MNIKKNVFISATISFIISTFIFIFTFNILKYYSLILSYFVCGFMFFLFFYTLFTKIYKKDETVKYLLVSMPSAVILALSLSILVYNYFNEQINLDMNIKIFLGTVGIVSVLGLFIPIFIYMLVHLNAKNK